MRNKIIRRLNALDRRRAQHQEAAERQAFFRAASIIEVAYYVGGLKSNECPFEGYARALKFRNLNGLLRAFEQALKKEDVSELQNRSDSAIRLLFARFRCDRSSQEAWEESIATMVEWLPNKWKAWIGSFVLKADHDKERALEERVEQIWSTAETMAAAELGAGKK